MPNTQSSIEDDEVGLSIQRYTIALCNGYVNEAMKLFDELNGVAHSSDLLNLFAACGSGNVTMLKFLLSKGANVNKRDKRSGNTPLIHFAGAFMFSYPSLDIPKLLLERGAKIDATNYEGYTALHFVVRCQHGGSLLDFLVSRGANINAKNNNGQTLLHLAVLQSRIDLIEKLIQLGTNINEKDTEGYTPLFYTAYITNNVEAVIKVSDSISLTCRCYSMQEQIYKLPISMTIRCSHT
jgi:ankyrin repeat protein